MGRTRAEPQTVRRRLAGCPEMPSRFHNEQPRAPIPSGWLVVMMVTWWASAVRGIIMKCIHIRDRIPSGCSAIAAMCMNSGNLCIIRLSIAASGTGDYATDQQSTGAS